MAPPLHTPARSPKVTEALTPPRHFRGKPTSCFAAAVKDSRRKSSERIRPYDLEFGAHFSQGMIHVSRPFPINLDGAGRSVAIAKKERESDRWSSCAIPRGSTVRLQVLAALMAHVLRSLPCPLPAAPQRGKLFQLSICLCCSGRGNQKRSPPHI